MSPSLLSLLLVALLLLLRTKPPPPLLLLPLLSSSLLAASTTDYRAHHTNRRPWLQQRIYKRILYFSVEGTWLMATRPSYDSDANTHASHALQASEYTLSSCSSNFLTCGEPNDRQGLQRGVAEVSKLWCELV